MDHQLQRPVALPASNPFVTTANDRCPLPTYCGHWQGTALMQPVNATDGSLRRVARASIWVLLTLSVPYALMMIATGVFFGLWNAPNPRLTLVWTAIVTSPLWLALGLVLSRRNPRGSVYAAILSWLVAALLLTYVYG